MNQQQQTVTTRPGNGAKSGKSGRQSHASTVVSRCNPAATDGANTVTTLAGQPPTEPGGASRNDPAVTLANTYCDAGNRDGASVTAGLVGICKQCGGEMVVKRPGKKKYCSNACRQAAWLQRHPDIAEAKAAAWRERTRQRIIAAGGVWIERE